MAMAQAKTVAALLKAQHPGLDVELVGIKSTGDKDKTTPLWQMNTVGIFSRELDDQLLAGEVDAVVHSFKDLGTERPAGLAMAAMLPRENPRDILLLRPDVEAKLAQGETLVIGSSAPRRMVQVPAFLAEALPKLGPTPQIKVENLRGNVNSRLEKLRDPAPGAPHYDGIVVALAGLGRLLRDDEAGPPIRALLAGLRPMVLPLTVCPTAPGQGIICVEARADDPATTALFQPLHCATTAAHVQAERAVLLQHGGGCHQGFGATQICLPTLAEPLLLVRGQTKAGVNADVTHWPLPAAPAGPVALWDGQGAGADLLIAAPVPYTWPADLSALFVTHARALPEGLRPRARIWVSGLGTWRKLAARGVWVEGCADGFGFAFVEATLAEPALQLPAWPQWRVLTHVAGQTHWPEGQTIATYEVAAAPAAAQDSTLQHATVAWWGSGTQFKLLQGYAGQVRTHACGPGHTAATLREAGLEPLVFPSHELFRAWVAHHALEDAA